MAYSSINLFLEVEHRNIGVTGVPVTPIYDIPYKDNFDPSLQCGRYSVEY